VKRTAVVIVVAALGLAGCGGGGGNDHTATAHPQAMEEAQRALHMARNLWSKPNRVPLNLRNALVLTARDYARAKGIPTGHLGPKAEYMRDLGRGLLLLAQSSRRQGEAYAAKAQLRLVQVATENYERLREEGR